MSGARTPAEWWSNVPMEALDALDQTGVAELHRAIGYLHDGVPRACPHPSDPVWLCAMHPALGVACPDCLRRHLGRHSHNEEHRCDACDTQAETMVPLLVQLPRPRWLRPPRTAKVRNRAAVFLCGIGFCEPCAAALGCPLERSA